MTRPRKNRGKKAVRTTVGRKANHREARPPRFPHPWIEDMGSTSIRVQTRSGQTVGTLRFDDFLPDAPDGYWDAYPFELAEHYRLLRVIGGLLPFISPEMYADIELASPFDLEEWFHDRVLPLAAEAGVYGKAVVDGLSQRPACNWSQFKDAFFSFQDAMHMLVLDGLNTPEDRRMRLMSILFVSAMGFETRTAEEVCDGFRKMSDDAKAALFNVALIPSGLAEPPGSIQKFAQELLRTGEVSPTMDWDRFLEHLYSSLYTFRSLRREAVA